jgi:hypothetical protein
LKPHGLHHMSHVNLRDHFDLLRHEESVASVPGLVSVGVGPDAVLQSGLPDYELGRLYLKSFESFKDGGMDGTFLDGPKGRVRIYVWRRGRMLDLGTRADLAPLGWGVVCDLIDAALDIQEG